MSFFRVSLKDKLTLLIAGLVLICISLVAYNSYLTAKDILMADLRGDLKNIAQALALTIPPQEIQTVLAGRNDSPAYRQLKQKLNSYTKLAEGRIKAAYVLVPSAKKDIWLFVADEELKNKKNMAGFKEEYNVSNFGELKKGLLLPAADLTVTRDKWGAWFSGYAPIFDRQGRPFAVLGLDLKDSDVAMLQQQNLSLVWLYFALGTALSFLLGWLGAGTIIKPLQSLLNGVRELRSNKYGSRIKIERNDELGDLITAFNEMSDKLNEVDKIKGDFLSVISHELYTPLTPILAGAEMLKAVGNLPAQQQEMVVMIEHQAKKLQGLIDDILDFSWLDLKDLKLKREPVNIKITADEVLARLQPAVQAKSIALDVKYQDHLPTIIADQKRLTHVIKILLDNAIKFTPEKGKINLSLEKNGDSVNFRLTDSGIGISKENLTRMFERFYQVEDVLTRTKGGLGLGLAIAKRIIEAHGGKIWAESAGPGQGAIFSFTLPIFV